MATSTYTPSDQSAHPGHFYFQDVELTPANLHNGTIQQRLSPTRYPQLGVKETPAVGESTIVVTTNHNPLPTTSTVLTATVSEGADIVPPVDGTVSFYDGGVLIAGSATAVVGGVAAYTLAGGFTVGAHSITAVYSGNDEVPVLTSAAVVVTATAIVLTTNLAPVHAVSTVLTGTITPGVTDGTVSFFSGGVLIAGSATAVVAGVAAYTLAGGFTVGAHSITAVYSGDATVPVLTSAAVVVTAS